MAEHKQKCRQSSFRHGLFVQSALTLTILLSISCSKIEQPAGNTFFAITPPPPKQEFRWSNGQMPKHLDPARAAAAPETDIVRAMYEGLTELDPVTLEAIPGVAEKWTVSDDLKTWTFTLREDAVWSNGQPVTAENFVESWTRLAELGSLAAHPSLTANIDGMVPSETSDPVPGSSDDAIITKPSNTETATMPAPSTHTNTNSTVDTEPESEPQKNVETDGPPVGFKALDARTLEVTLVRPDKDFPRLVANPVFLPVYADGNALEPEELTTDAVTNGAFRMVAIEPESLTLERSETYWNREAVELERVIFKPAEKPEDALLAYRSGELDAVTNANFEPLALKLLEPYEDFRKGAFSALNFYEVNTERPPFNDRRVRQALAMAIERERLTEGELEGSTRPAFSFLPFATGSQKKLIQDKDRARDLLEEAGFPDGEMFPVIRLVVNRNDAQQRIARSVARMWKQNLNLETAIIVKDAAEIDSVIESGNFDLVRRNVVFPTANEAVGLAILFGDREPSNEKIKPENLPVVTASPTVAVGPGPTELGSEEGDIAANAVMTEEIAILEMAAIPLYFPVSYSLVKPYVSGFDMNVLDAPLVRNVRIDNSWQP